MTTAVAQPMPARREADRRRWLALACGGAAAWLLAHAAPARAQAPLTEGEVRKVDRDAGKLTLKHGDIKSLDMPAMTMVFQVHDKAMLDKLQPGTRIQFKAANEGGKFVVTELKVVQ